MSPSLEIRSCASVAGALDVELGDRPRLTEQEHLAAAHAEQLAGDGFAGGRGERRDQGRDVMRADLQRALLVGLLRVVGRLDDVGDAGAGERRDALTVICARARSMAVTRVRPNSPALALA